MKKTGKIILKKIVEWWPVVILTLLLLVFAVILFFNPQVYEFFDDSFDEYFKFDFYVITTGEENRLKNIKKQQEKFKKPIIRFDAVLGDKLNLDDYNNIEQSFKSNDPARKKVIGEFLTHLKIYKKIKSNGPRDGYSIILQDNFSILPQKENIEKTLLELIHKMDGTEFDLIILENNIDIIGKEEKKGICVMKPGKSIQRNMTLLIKNKSIDKFLNETKFIQYPIDVLLSKAIQEKRLIAYVACPFLFNSNDDIFKMNQLVIRQSIFV